MVAVVGVGGTGVGIGGRVVEVVARVVAVGAGADVAVATDPQATSRTRVKNAKVNLQNM